MKVFVTDGDARASLAIVRSLGEAGHTVVVGERVMPSLAQASRHCSGRVRYPDPVVNPDAFIEHVAEYVRSKQVEVILPVTDITTFLVTGHRARFEPACAIPFADARTVERAADKIDMLQTAARLGLPVPRSVVVKSATELPADLEYPLVIKPARSRVRTSTGWMSTAVGYANNADELRRDVSSRPAYEFPVMLQERIVGPGSGVFACYDKGKAVALFSHRRLRERPPWGGVSVLCESVPLPERATDYAVRLLDEIGWHGVAMVEFKNDTRDGEPKLMEINGRFWGSLQLAIDSGVDFPQLLLDSVTRRDTRDPKPYRVGVRSRWFWGDVDNLIQTLMPSNKERIKAVGISRATALRDFLRFWQPNLHYDNPRWNDLGPGLYESSARLTAVAQSFLNRSAKSIPVLRSPARAPAIVPSGLKVTLAAGPEADDLCEHRWNDLAAQNETNSVFQTHQWARSWWSAFRDEHESMLFTVHDGARMVGLAPLVLNRGQRDGVVHFLGDSRADYCDVLAASNKPAVLQAVVDALREDDRWSVVELNNIPAASQTVPLMKAICERAGWSVIAGTQYTCPALLVRGHESEAAAILNKESLRRRENFLRKAGTLQIRDLKTAEEIEPLLDTFFRQHIARWKNTGTPSLFEQARNRNFYRRVTREVAPAGWLTFTVVEFNDAPVAFHFGFDYEGALLWYKPSFDPAMASRSPGMVLLRHLIRSTIDQGRRELDFTLGDEEFKKRFTNVVRHTSKMRIFRDRSRYVYERSRRQFATAVKTRA